MSNPQWTVSIIAQYSESDEIVCVTYCQLINSIIAHRNPNVNFYVLRYHKEKEVTKFFSYDFVSPDKDRVETPFEPKCTQNFYDSPGVIIEFFRDFSLKSNAGHHFLITWGHGAGFGLFSEGDVPESFVNLFGGRNLKGDFSMHLLNKTANMLFFYNRMFSSGATENIPIDKKSIDVASFLEPQKIFALGHPFIFHALKKFFRIVSMESVAFAIKETFGNKKIKIDYMYSMNCYMQMFETGYLLKGYVHYYAAAENYQLFPGPDYDALFKDLSTTYSTKDPDLKKLSVSIIANFEKKYQRSEIRDLLRRFSTSMERVITDISEVFLSVTNLEFYEQLKDKIDLLATQFVEKKNGLYLLIQQARKRCQYVSSTDYGIIDIAHFCKELLKEKLQNETLSKDLKEIVTLIEKAGYLVVCKRDAAPSLCISTLSREEPPPTLCPHGISIFFPKDKNNSRSAEYVHYFIEHFYKQNTSNFMNSFLMESSWRNFVIDYFSADLPDD